MVYCICEDLVGDTAVKIHLKSCTYYVNHVPTETTKWHEVDDYKSAEALAEKISQNYKKGWADNLVSGDKTEISFSLDPEKEDFKPDEEKE